MRVLRSFGTPGGAALPTTQRDIPEEYSKSALRKSQISEGNEPLRTRNYLRNYQLVTYPSSCSELITLTLTYE